MGVPYGSALFAWYQHSCYTNSSNANPQLKINLTMPLPNKCTDGTFCIEFPIPVCASSIMTSTLHVFHQGRMQLSLVIPYGLLLLENTYLHISYNFLTMVGKERFGRFSERNWCLFRSSNLLGRSLCGHACVFANMFFWYDSSENSYNHRPAQHWDWCRALAEFDPSARSQSRVCQEHRALPVPSLVWVVWWQWFSPLCGQGELPGPKGWCVFQRVGDGFTVSECWSLANLWRPARCHWWLHWYSNSVYQGVGAAWVRVCTIANFKCSCTKILKGIAQ